MYETKLEYVSGELPRNGGKRCDVCHGSAHDGACTMGYFLSSREYHNIDLSWIVLCNACRKTISGAIKDLKKKHKQVEGVAT